jgi:RNA polymerase sigma factor (sigma-70 family)
MGDIPKTSVSLLREIQGDPQSARWVELYMRYSEPMAGFVKSRFPTLEAEDLIQETMAALAERLPGYIYQPDEKGHFRNYLMGILKHKAMDALSRRSREASAREALRKEPRRAATQPGDDDEEWKTSALEVAISQLLADESLNALHRTVFRHVALNRESPEDVAREFGISRGNVDVIKKRMIDRLSEMVARLTAS